MLEELGGTRLKFLVGVTIQDVRVITRSKVNENLIVVVDLSWWHLYVMSWRQKFFFPKLWEDVNETEFHTLPQNCSQIAGPIAIP